MQWSSVLSRHPGPLVDHRIYPRRTGADAASTA